MVLDNGVKLHILHCGEVWVDRALPFREKTLHPLPATGWLRPNSKKIWIPVSAYLIEHPQGPVLIDTGWHEDIRTNERKHVGRLAYSMFRGRLPEGQAIHEQLREKGISIRDLRCVVLTHLHSDHVSGVKHVQEAQQILTSELEWQAAQKQLGYVRSMWQEVKIDTFEFTQNPYGPYQLGLDLFNDGLFHLVFTPGHSRGQVSVLVRTRQGYVLLASDVGYATESWEKDILPGVTDNKQQAIDSLQWVKEFSKREDCLAVVANHDPNVKPQTFE